MANPKTKSREKDATDKPEWMRFEELIAVIQRQLAPNAEVRHDHHVRGKYGDIRKLDVSISLNIGTVPVFIAIDCKKHKRRVNRKDVAAFAEQLEDVGAYSGVMISSSGFDSGAIKVATQKNVLLQTYRQAEHTDWAKLVGKEAWLIFTMCSLEEAEFFVILGSHRSQYKLPAFNVALFDESGNECGSLNKLFWDCWEKAERPRPIDNREHKIENVSPLVFIRIDDRLTITHGFIIRGKVVPKKYVVNLQMMEGKILEETKTGNTKYLQIVTQGFNWKQIKKSQAGMPLTKKEWEAVEMKKREIKFEDGYDYVVELTGYDQ